MRTLFIIIFFTSILVSCQEETRVNSFSGRLYSNCNSTRSSSEVALKTNTGESFSEQILLGGAITDANGYFNFTYELEERDKGTGDIILINEQGFQTILTSVPVNMDNSLNIYINNLATLYLDLSGGRVWQVTDTLFYGIDDAGNISSTIQPSNGRIDTLFKSVIQKYEGSTEATFFYGIGRDNLNQAIDSLSNPKSSFQNFPIELEGCNNIEQIDLIIN